MSNQYGQRNGKSQTGALPIEKNAVFMLKYEHGRTKAAHSASRTQSNNHACPSPAVFLADQISYDRGCYSFAAECIVCCLGERDGQRRYQYLGGYLIDLVNYTHAAAGINCVRRNRCNDLHADAALADSAQVFTLGAQLY